MTKIDKIQQRRDKRAAALRENLKKRKALQAAQKDTTKTNEKQKNDADT